MGTEGERWRTREEEMEQKKKTAENGRETKKMRETEGERERQGVPYQCIAGGIRCNWGVCVCARACVCERCVIEVTLVQVQNREAQQTDGQREKPEHQLRIYGCG